MEEQGIVGRVIDKEQYLSRMPKDVVETKDEVVEKTDVVEPGAVEEKPVQPVSSEEKPEQKASEEKVVDFVNLFNEKFGKDFKEEKEIRALFDKVGGYDELEKSNKDLLAKLGDYKKVADGVNPMKYFASEDDFIRNQFLLKNKDKFDESKLEVLSSLSPERISKLSPVEAIKKDLVVNNGVSAEDAEEYVSETYGDLDDMSGAAKVKLQLAAKEAKGRLTGLYEGIEVPKGVSVDEHLVQRRDSWQKSVKATVDGIDKLLLADGVDVEIPAESKEGVADELVSMVLNSGMELTEENLKSVAGKARDILLARNIDDAMKAYAATKIEEEKAKWRADIHNDKPLSTDVSGSTKATRTNDDIVKNFALLNR
jgi:hypothetical protein